LLENADGPNFHFENADGPDFWGPLSARAEASGKKPGLRADVHNSQRENAPASSTCGSLAENHQGGGQIENAENPYFSFRKC
jgi:hypothetical protein